MNRYSLLPFLLIVMPLVCVLAAFGVIGWGVVAAVAVAVAVLALAARATTRRSAPAGVGEGVHRPGRWFGGPKGLGNRATCRRRRPW
ncbi:hypothetical protein [Streptomyces sp. NPDC002221]|uniref:hypothetical protein n=1 Tax=Streptomyces sp. NPDC002221 TaxID=3364639 RepID=UPI0036740270